jgi:peptidoglycan/xylan/chitin deacetylase (PgdA/CDA1 family)/uncharacterized protein YgiM (DUF1202 family)
MCSPSSSLSRLASCSSANELLSLLEGKIAYRNEEAKKLIPKKFTWYDMAMKRFSFTIFSLLLLTSCGGGSKGGFDEFTFTAEDAAEISALLDQIESEDGSRNGSGVIPIVGEDEEVVLNVADAHRFDPLRTSLDAVGEDTFRVTNTFLNVRSEASIHSRLVDELKKGARVKVLSFPNASWAEVELLDGRKGFVSRSYIAQVVSDVELPEIKKKYEGMYAVDFRFLNVRDAPSAQGHKLGELQSQQIIKPIAFHEDWARIEFEGKEGFVSAQYLRPFAPTFIVRQERFNLPMLRYRADETSIADTLVKHLAYLKSQNKRLMTLRDFYDLLLQQEEKDVRLPLGSVLLLVTDVTAETIKEVSDALRASGARASIFLASSAIESGEISPQTVKSLVANGNDVQSSGHTGEDLRAMTNTAVQREFARSREILENVTGKDVFAVVYPSGGVNDRIVDQAVQTGYLFGLTLTPETGDGIDRSQFLRMPSNLITEATSEDALAIIVRGE